MDRQSKHTSKMPCFCSNLLPHIAIAFFLHLYQIPILVQSNITQTLHKETEESERRQKAAEIQKLVWEDRCSVASNTLPPYLSNGTANGDLAKQNSDSAVKIVHAKEQEIEKRKVQVREKVQAQLNCVENEARSLDQLRKELEGLEDPTKQEVADIRKKIEVVDRELRPMKQLYEKKSMLDH